MKAKLPKATGGIQKRPNGQYTVRLTIPGKGRRSLGTYPTKEEAKTMLASALAELAGTESEPGERESFAAYGRRWIDRRDALGVVAAPNERRNWSRYVAETKLGAMAPLSVRRADVRDWLEEVQMRHPIRWHNGKLRNRMPDDVYVLPRRPSFVGGKTDSCAYAWFVWGAEAHGEAARLHVLEAGE